MLHAPRLRRRAHLGHPHPLHALLARRQSPHPLPHLPRTRPRWQHSFVLGGFHLFLSLSLHCETNTNNTADPDETCVSLTAAAAAATTIEQNTPMLCRVHCNKLFYPYARSCLEPFPKFCSNSSSTIITYSLSKCSRAAEHMCVCTCPECVCACSRRQCRVHDAVPRRLLARVRRHGGRPLQRERHRQRQHHVQQRACHHRPRSARLLSAPSFQHFTDFSHFPGLHLRCC